MVTLIQTITEPHDSTDYDVPNACFNLIYANAYYTACSNNSGRVGSRVGIRGSGWGVIVELITMGSGSHGQSEPQRRIGMRRRAPDPSPK
jgi:hypothetical protein